jgi:hypothetical protein
MSSPTPDPLTWPSDRMTRLLDMTTRRINQLVSEGVLLND